MTRSRLLVVALAAACLCALPQAALSQGTDLADKGKLLLPTDSKSLRRLKALEDFIKAEDWEAAAALAQLILDQPSDAFVQMTVKGPDGKPVEVLTGVRVATNRLLGTLPKEGYEVYEKMYGEKAAELLARARKESDKQLFADVAQRYLWTKSGPEANERLATILLDRGDFMAAAQAFDRLIQRSGVEKLEPLTLYKAAIAFHRGNSKEDKQNEEKVWKQLTTKAPKGLTIGGRERTLKELEETLKKPAKEPPTSLPDWPMFGGTPSRDGQGQGGAPFMQPLWRLSLFGRKSETFVRNNGELVKRWIVGDESSVVRQLESKGEAVIPAFAPVVATGPGNKNIIFRDYDSVIAVNPMSGKLAWHSTLQWSMEGMLRAGDRRGAALAEWVSSFRQTRPSAVIENATVGTMSSDGYRVYLIDDLQVPPGSREWGPRLGFDGPGMKDGFPSAVRAGVAASKVLCIDIANGKLRWEMGGHEFDDDEPRQGAHDFRDSHFLGPPLPVGGRLYFVNEKDREIRLVCLDTARVPRRDVQDKDLDAAIAWVQPLGRAKEKIVIDYGRRINGAQIAYCEGVLVCPTNTGALVGVDALTHDLLWAHVYAEERPKTAPPVSEWKASAPVVQGGKVVFALPDGPELRCLNLRDGRLLWGVKRGVNDVYLGGVFAGRVVVVGKKEVRGLNLDDGKELWRVPTGMPSGRGVASDNVYYLPLKDAGENKRPEVVAIDVVKGCAVAHTPVKKDPRAGTVEVPGNLVFADGQLVSQSATTLAVYPLLKTKLKEMEELKKGPNSPQGLLERGGLRYHDGNLLGAVEDFRQPKPAQGGTRRFRGAESSESGAAP